MSASRSKTCFNGFHFFVYFGVAGALPLLGGAACHTRTLANSCQNDGDCPSTMHCRLTGSVGLCMPGPHCSVNAQCPTLLPVCQSGACIDPCLSQQATGETAICPPHQTCRVHSDAAPFYACDLLASCGDGIANNGEQCDGTDLAGATCKSLGMGSGSLRCTPACNLDVSDCSTALRDTSTCGNGRLDVGEACDGAEHVANANCNTLGYAEGGPLTCNPATCNFDTRSCYACGDGQLEGTETCDRDSFAAGASCAQLGFTAGTLHCNLTCTGYDTSLCSTCGNGVREDDEVCDGGVGTTTCIGLGFQSGPLGCLSDCSNYDTSQCNAWYPIGTSYTDSGLSNNTATAGSGARMPSLAFGSDGAPLVTWLDDNGFRCVLAAVAQNATWVGVNSARFTVDGACSDQAGRPQLTVHPGQGLAYVVWSYPQLGDIFVAQSSPTGWQAWTSGSMTVPGISGTPAGQASAPTLAISHDAQPWALAVWQHGAPGSAATQQVYAKLLQNTNNTWTPLVTASSNSASGNGLSADAPPPAGQPPSPQAAVDTAHNIYVAWMSAAGLDSTITVRMLAANGSDWVTLPATPLPNHATWASQAAMAVDANDTLWLAYRISLGSAADYSQLVVTQYQNGVWVDAGGGTEQWVVTPGLQYSAQTPSLAFDAQNRPVLAWQDAGLPYTQVDSDTTTQVYLRRWSGSSWLGIDGSDVGHGISRSTGQAANPSVAWQHNADGHDTVCVAWENAIATDAGISVSHQVQLLCHDV